MAGRRTTGDEFYEIVAAALPYGPPLTAAERTMRAAIIAAFVLFLVAESWLIWSLWSLWG